MVQIKKPSKDYFEKEFLFVKSYEVTKVMLIFIDYGISIMVKLRDKYFRKRQEDVEQLFRRKQDLSG